MGSDDGTGLAHADWRIVVKTVRRMRGCIMMESLRSVGVTGGEEKLLEQLGVVARVAARFDLILPISIEESTKLTS